MASNIQSFVKSPLNYIGGKYRLLPQLIPVFPDKIDCFIDLFAGGANVGINVNANKIILNDNLTYLIDFYKEIKKLPKQSVLDHIHNRISEFKLSITNEDAYKKLRTIYNQTKNPLDLFVLVAYSFNHQIRFNNAHEFNTPFGKNRSRYNSCIENNLILFIDKLKSEKIILSDKDFTKLNLHNLGVKDFVYADPPYLITTGTYNDGKRGFSGWGAKDEINLLNLLDNLDIQGVKFALSNVLTHKGKTNEILTNWLMSHPKYYVTEINTTYLNANYHTKNRPTDITREVLITNYCPVKPSTNNDSLTPKQEKK